MVETTAHSVKIRSKMKHSKEYHYIFHIFDDHICLSIFCSVLKYYGLPKFTDVSFKKAESYPEVTFCPKDLKVRVKTGFSFKDSHH